MARSCAEMDGHRLEALTPAVKHRTMPLDPFHLSNQEIFMGMFSFIKEAGEKLFGIGKAQAATPAAPAAPTPEQAAELSETAGNAIATYINSMGLKVEALEVSFDAATETVTVSGVAPDQTTREKVVLCCGNVANVTKVNDLMTVSAPEPESQMYTVVKGDNLSKISKQFYGTPNKYPQIFEANKPMLTHPDKIYPGQVLRIPAA
jgi:nucleoid-associated protein YgaU